MSKKRTGAAAAPTRRRIGWIGRTLIGVGALLALLLIVVVLLGPTIAGALAPGLIERAANGRAPGRLSVGGVSLSWTGPQRIRSVEYRDEAGGVVATGEIDATTSLVAAIFGARDLGTITLRGRADLSASSAAAPHPAQPPPAAGGAPGGSLRLPPTLRAKLVLDGVTISSSDPSLTGGGKPVGLSDIKGSVELAAGQPVRIALRGAGLNDPGAIELDATIDHILGADGAVTTETATIDLSAQATAPARLVDAILKQQGFADDALAGGLTLHVRAQGGRAAATGSVRITGGEGSLVRGDAGFAVADGVASLSGPATLSAPITQALVDRFTAGGSSRIVLDAPVIATLSVPTLRAPLDAGPDLRGVSFTAQLATTGAAGTIRAPGAPEERFALGPVAARLEAPDLSGPVTLRATTNATFQQRSAGELVVDISATDLLDAQGRPRLAGAPSLRGKVELSGLATALAQPFVDGYGLDLARDVGPTLDASLLAMTRGAGAQPGTVPPTDLTLMMHTQKLSARADVALAADAVRTREDGVVARLESPAPTIARLLSGSGVRVGGDGALTLSVSGVDLPLDGATPRLAAARAHVEVETERLTVWPREGSPSIDAANARLTLDAAPGAPLTAVFNADLASGGKPFTAGARIAADGLIGADGAISLASLRPTGNLTITDAPTSIADAFVAQQADRDLVRQALGDAITVALTARPGDAGRTVVSLDARAQSAAARATLTAAPGDSARVTGAVLDATVTPAIVDVAVRRFAPDTAPAPGIRAAARASVRVADFAVPLGPGWKPDTDRLGPIEAQLTLADDLVLTNVPLSGSPATVGVGAVAAQVRMSAAGAGGVGGSLAARLFDPASPATTTANLVAEASRDAAGALSVTARLNDLRTRDADRLLARPDLLELSLGESAALSVTAQRKSAADPTVIDLSVKAPRLTTDLRAQVMSDRVELARPTNVTWSMDERWAARYLLPERPDGTSPLRIVGATDLSVSLRKIAVGLGGGPLKPGVFAIDARASAPSLAFLVADGSVRRYKDVTLVIAPGGAPGSLAVQAAMTGDGGLAGSFQASGEVVGFADQSGGPTPDAATITGRAEGTLPSELLDALAGAGGRIQEALGDSVKINARAAGLSRRAGSLHVEATSPRASATLDGAVRDGAFVADKPASAQFTTITPRFGQLVFSRLFPLIGEIEKRPEDGPAVLQAQSLVAPVDGDMSKLSGVVTLDLGKLQYRAAPFFGDLLRATKNKSDSALFGNWPQLVVNIDRGVATYDRVTLPMGDFALATRGTVDLVKRKVDVVTYVPLIALVDEVANIAGKVPGVTRDTLIPLRTRGSFGSLKTEPALDLLLKENVEQPGGLIDDLFKKIQGASEKKKKPKQPAGDESKPR